MTVARSARRLDEIPVKEIHVSKSNPRVSPRDVADLADSIASVGILEPLLVLAEPKGYRLVAGSRRFAAAKRAALTTVPCVVLPDLSERDELAVSIVENLHRLELSPIEKGEAFERLVETGLSQEQVAQMVGLSGASVSICRRLARELIPEARGACHEGTLPLMKAYELVRHPPEVQRELFLRTSAPKQKDPRGRKSIAETSLLDALAAHRKGDDVEALGRAQEAVRQLRRRTGLREEGTPPSSLTPLRSVPSGNGARIACRGCRAAVTIAVGEDSFAALKNHYRQSPTCEAIAKRTR